ncbi:MAG TPA: hypothetical protein VGM39_03405 [Kofleriaceae bacterium]|jgi:hypothetical protein
MKLPILSTLAALSLVAWGGCGSGSDGLSTDHEGVYTVSSWTRTTNGCEGPVTPIARPDRTANFYVQSTSAFGVALINVVPCDDLATCQTEAESSTLTFSLLGWQFVTGSDATAWTGTGGSAAGANDHVCSATAREATMAFSGTTAHIESREKAVTWPAPANDECDADALAAHAVDAACTSLVTLDAAFVADL